MNQKLSRRNFFRSCRKAPVAGALGAAALAQSQAASGLVAEAAPAPSWSRFLTGNHSLPLHPDRVFLWENTRREIRQLTERRPSESGHFAHWIHRATQ